MTVWTSGHGLMANIENDSMYDWLRAQRPGPPRSSMPDINHHQQRTFMKVASTSRAPMTIPCCDAHTHALATVKIMLVSRRFSDDRHRRFGSGVSDLNEIHQHQHSIVRFKSDSNLHLHRRPPRINLPTRNTEPPHQLVSTKNSPNNSRAYMALACCSLLQRFEERVRQRIVRQ